MLDKLKSFLKGMLKFLSVFPLFFSLIGYVLDYVRNKYRTIRDERLRRELSDALDKAESTKDTSDIERFFNP